MSGFHAIAINDPAVKQDENYRMYQEGTKMTTGRKTLTALPTLVQYGLEMLPSQTSLNKRSAIGGQTTLVRYSMKGWMVSGMT